ncbi:MAG: hypothetical protein AB7U45_05025 [Desulfamplus sp.]
MISFLSSPKAFTGKIADIQKNAIQSWKNVHSDAEIIIYGDSAGTHEACMELGVIHIPDVQCSPSGVPYFNAIVEHANLHARHNIQVYINCDILLHNSIINAIKCINFPRYLVVGQRIDLGKNVEMSMLSEHWQYDLRILAKENKAVLHAPSGMDYFIFVRGMWQGLAPLVIGRGGYDSALVAFCFRSGIPLIDATYAIPAVHQFHDYGHIAGAQNSVFRGKDATNNYVIHNVKHSTPTSADAEWQIICGRLNRSLCRGDWLRRSELYIRFNNDLKFIGLISRVIWRFLVGLNLYHIKNLTIYDVLESYKTSVFKLC